MDPLPIHGSCLKLLGRVALAAACCVVVGLVALTFNRHPCLGLNKAGGAGSCAMPEAIDKRSTWMSPHTPMQRLRSGRPSGAGPRPCLPLPGHEETVDASSDERCEHPQCASNPSGEAEYYGGKGDNNDECIQQVEGLECVHRRAFWAFFFTIDKRSKKMSPPTSWWCLRSVRPSGAGPRPCLPGLEERGAGVGTTCGDFASIFLGVGDPSGGATEGGRHHGNPCSFGGRCTSHVLWVPHVMWVPTRGMSVRWQLYGRHATSSSGLRGYSYHCGLHAEASGIAIQDFFVSSPWSFHFGWHGYGLQCRVITWTHDDQVNNYPVHAGLPACGTTHPLLFAFTPVMQSLVLHAPTLSRQLLLRCWFNDSVSTWVLGSSYFYRRRRHQHLSVVGMFFFNGSTDPLFTDATRGQSIWVHASLTPLRIPLAGRFVLIYVSVDAVVSFRLQNLDVICSSFEDLYVL